MELAIPYINSINKTSLEEISGALDKLEQHDIDQLPWSEFIYRPEVSFAIAHTGDRILIKYFVQEKAIRILHFEDNSPVHEDSCVEFFIAIDNDDEYYNLEFNCAGTCLFGFGKNASERKLIGSDIIRKIGRQGTIKTNVSEKDYLINWELTLMIPMEVFVHHRVTSLKNKHCRVNFYKCGDKLPEPHFLSWQSMTTSAPDFHLTKFFGDAYFE